MRRTLLAQYLVAIALPGCIAGSQGDFMLDRTYRVLLALLIVCAATFAVAPQSHAQSALNAKRIALVIGNSSYQSITELTNPKNDATDIA